MSKPITDLIQTDNIANKTINEWAKCWWQWFLSMGEDENPAYSSSEYSRKNDYNQGRVPSGWPDDTKRKVWFLSGAHGRSSITRSILPENDWCILVPAYVMGGSKHEFPHLDKEQIKKLVEDDVNAVGENLGDAIKRGTLKAVLDGQDLTDHLELVKSDWFTVTGIPDDNIYDLDLEDNSIEMYSVGYFLFLQPLQCGDHIVSLQGKAPNYMIDTTFNLTVRGGVMSPRFFKTSNKSS